MIVNPKIQNKKLSTFKSKLIGKLVLNNPQLNQSSEIGINTSHVQIKNPLPSPKFTLNSSLYEINILASPRSKSEMKSYTKEHSQSSQLPPISKRYHSYLDKINSLSQLPQKPKHSHIIHDTTQQEYVPVLKTQRQLISLSRSSAYEVQKQQDNHSFVVDLRTSISSIKQRLVEGQEYLQFSFIIPKVFFNGLSSEATSNQLHQLMIEAFNQIGKVPQIISIKKFINCVVMKDAKLCIIWYFNGKVYFGGWNRYQGQGHKDGVGLEWHPGRYIYYGQFEDNKKEGYGIMKKENKETYIGCWRENQRNGWGRIYSNEGSLTTNGEFEDGCLRSMKS